MTEDNNKKYFYLILGYLGILLILFAIVRYVSTVEDTIGLVLAIFGSICISTFFDFSEKQIGITTKVRIIIRISFIVIFILLLWTFI